MADNSNSSVPPSDSSGQNPPSPPTRSPNAPRPGGSLRSSAFTPYQRPQTLIQSGSGSGSGSGLGSSANRQIAPPQPQQAQPAPRRGIPVPPPPPPPIPPRYYECYICGRRFRTPKALCGHLRTHPERQWRGAFPPLGFSYREFVDVLGRINVRGDPQAAEHGANQPERQAVLPDLNRSPPQEDET